MSRWLAALSVITSSLVAESAQADVFFLINGGRIEAELLNPDQSPRETYILRTDFGGRLTLAHRQVERVVVKSAIEKRYEKRLHHLADTADAHWDMAERCQQAKLVPQREFHLEQVLRLEPDHEGARRALGYSRIDGRWMRQEEWMEAQGYVRYRGGWRLPQEIELERTGAEHDRKVITWRKQLKTWRGWIVKGRERRGRGEHEMRMVREPLAAVALADMLNDDKENRNLKLLYVDILGELPSDVAIDALAKHAIQDPDPKVRDACLDELSRIKPVRAVDTFVAALSHKKNYVVRRAAVALAAMNDQSATLPLIDALITEHKHLVGGGGMQPTFSDRGSSLSMGGKPEIKKVKQKNEPVLHTLNALHPGVNFGYNQAAWKNWYIVDQTPPPVSLRRSE